MRIATWNCYRGESRQRAGQLAGLRPDLVVLQECGQPAVTDSQCVWFGSQPIKGVGVVAMEPWHVQPGPSVEAVPDSVYPLEVVGPISFNLLSVWAMRRPTYVRAVLDALDHYREFLHAAPSLIIGDFNSHPRWDNDDPTANHSLLVKRLRQEFGLVSAFHSFADKSKEDCEPATLYWQWNENQPFHIDYCFMPEAWAYRLRAVEIGGYQDWAKESDHRPLVVEIAE